MLRAGMGTGNPRPLEAGGNEVKLPPDSRPDDDVDGPENWGGNAGVRGDLQWFCDGSSGVEFPADSGPFSMNGESQDP